MTMMYMIILLLFVGLIVVGGYFGFKQLQKLLENMKILHHRQSQSVTLGDVDSVVETRVETAVSEAMSLERRRLEEMYQTAMEQVVEAEALAKKSELEQSRPAKRRKRLAVKQTDFDAVSDEEEKSESGVSSTYELQPETVTTKKQKKKRIKRKQKNRIEQEETDPANN